MAGQPKAPFYVVLGVVVLALIAFAVYRADIFAPEEKAAVKPGEQQIDPAQLGQIAEASDPAGVTTVKEYSFRPAARLPEITGTSAYKPLQDNTVRFALNVWAGWGPIILANEGFKPGKIWKTPDGGQFKVELVLIDDPVAMRNAYAAGEIHIGWATLDTASPRPATTASCRGSISRSTGPTAATASWCARTSAASPTCAAKSWCWPKTRPRSISP
jgi:hypothetical protein